MGEERKLRDFEPTQGQKVSQKGKQKSSNGKGARGKKRGGEVNYPPGGSS